MDWIKKTTELPLTMKGITKFRGHEGEPLEQGNVYFNGKKVGFLSEGDWGGPCSLELTSNEAKAAVESYIAAQPDVRFESGSAHKYDEEFLVIDLLDCSQFLKTVKLHKKRGDLVFVLPGDEPWSYRKCQGLSGAEALKKMRQKYPDLIEI